LGNAKSLDVSLKEHTSLEGTVCIEAKERKQVPYSKMGKHSYIMTFGSSDENQSECNVSESRMRENRLSGLNGGILSCYSGNKEGCLP